MADIAAPTLCVCHNRAKRVCGGRCPLTLDGLDAAMRELVR